MKKNLISQPLDGQSASTRLQQQLDRELKDGLDTTVCTSTVPTPGYPQMQLTAAKIAETMQRLKDSDPIARFFKSKGINIETHDVYMHTSLKDVWNDPPSYVKFTDLVEPTQILAVERLSLKDRLFINPLRDC